MSAWSLDTTRYSLSSLKLFVFGVPILGCQVSEPEESIEGDLMWGNSPVSIGKVIGKVTGSVKLGLIPEMHDTLLQTIGNGFAEIPIGFVANLYEPANPSGVYFLSNDTLWLKKNGLAIAREGAVITSEFETGNLMSWNGVTAIDMAARASDPVSLGSIFASAGLSI
jgi:hypothetical protein